MSVPISRRSFRRSHRASMSALALLMVAGITAASADQPSARFSIHAEIRPSASAPANASMSLRANLSPMRASLIGDGYALSARAESSPTGCGGDTIFANGFDP
jgi:hypothetical protein